MRWAIDTWSPDYGAGAADELALSDSSGSVDVNVELEADEWRPLSPPAELVEPRELLFVDGVRRIEAQVWITDSTHTRQGIAATYGAGVVRCNGDATVVDARIERGLFCEGNDLEPLVTRHGTFEVRPTGGGPDALSLALQGAMADLESRVAIDAATGGLSGKSPAALSPGEATLASRPHQTSLIVVDGPLRDRRHLRNAVGYVKTHHVAYLPALVADTVVSLAAGQRTPLFVIGGGFTRTSWYLRLPGPIAHGWSGIVRCEVSPDVDLRDAVDMADVTAAVLPRYASERHKDPRAPQNLYPIAGLERELKRRLGDRTLIHRALSEAQALPA